VSIEHPISLFISFEEMRMRYERGRPEDLKQIDELRNVVDSQEKDIFDLTEQLRELQLQLQQNQTNQPNSNSSKKNKGRNAKNISNGRPNGAQSQQHQQNGSNQKDQQRTKKTPPPLIKTVIYEDENENELYEQQLRDERDNFQKIDQQNDFTVRLPESPDYSTKNQTSEEFSEAHLVSEYEIINQVVAACSSDKLQEINIEIISTIEPAHIQVVPSTFGEMDLD